MDRPKLKIIFMGSPQEVVCILERLRALANQYFIDLIGVISQPARPFGRKRVLKDPPVAEYAKSHSILTLQPESSRSDDFLSQLRSLAPDLIFTAAYGQILSDDFLSIPSKGTINFHPSLIPKYRGATPVQAALLNGDKQTGITALFTVKALDAGDVILQKKFDIKDDETADVLMSRLFTECARSITEVLERVCDPHFKPSPQDPNAVTHCKKIQKSDGLVDWSQPADIIFSQYQGLTSWPGIFTFMDKKRILITKILSTYDKYESTLQPGQFIFDKNLKGLVVRSGDGYIVIGNLKPASSKEIDAASFWNGHKINKVGYFHADS